MGIQNIQILINEPQPNSAVRQARALQEQLVAEHRQGKHPDGMKQRACPLCQAGK